MQRPALARIADVVAADLENRVLEGSLKPGDRLPPERELAVEMGVSRPSLREAIQRLQSKGLLITRHGGGTFVTDRLESPFVDLWQDMLAGHPGLQRDILEFRHMLEGEAAALAAERATDVDLQRIGRIYDALERSYETDDMAATVDLDVKFHQSIAEASHNALIGHLTASLLRVIHVHVQDNLAYLHRRGDEWVKLGGQHRAIWDAIRTHDPQTAAHTAREHIGFVRASMARAALDEERRGPARRRLTDQG